MWLIRRRQSWMHELFVWTSRSNIVPVLILLWTLSQYFESTLATRSLGSSVTWVERKVQSIEKMFRGIKSETICDWDVHTNDWCIQFRVQLINHIEIWRLDFFFHPYFCFYLLIFILFLIINKSISIFFLILLIIIFGRP